jgi:hypothetical protein
MLIVECARVQIQIPTTKKTVFKAISVLKCHATDAHRGYGRKAHG